MCINCARKYGGHDVLEITPEMREAINLVIWVYCQDEYGVGGPLHVQLDDYNLEDRHWEPGTLDWWEEGIPAAGSRPASSPVGILPSEHREKFLRLVSIMRSLNEARRAAVVGIAHGEFQDPEAVMCAHCVDLVQPVTGGHYLHVNRNGNRFRKCSPSHLSTMAAPREVKTPPANIEDDDGCPND